MFEARFKCVGGAFDARLNCVAGAFRVRLRRVCLVFQMCFRRVWGEFQARYPVPLRTTTLFFCALWNVAACPSRVWAGWEF